MMRSATSKGSQAWLRGALLLVISLAGSGCIDSCKSTLGLADSEAPPSERVVMEGSGEGGREISAGASWKDVGRRFQDLERERAEMLNAMKKKTGGKAGVPE
jgi:hypothetical protein